MNFGVWLPNCRHLATPDIIRGAAVRAEQLGYDSVWVSDHVVVPHANVVNFGETVFDPLVTLAVVAGATRRVRLGTTVLIVPYRNAVVTAKMIASLDALSGGRVVLGIGAGWVAAESAALGVPFAERGAMTDEYLAAMQELWTSRAPSFAGKYTRFGGLVFEPKPLQKPHPPIWVGGHSRAALRRAARLGAAWHPINRPPAELQAGQAEIARLCQASGRATPPALTLRNDLRVRRRAPGPRVPRRRRPRARRADGRLRRERAARARVSPSPILGVEWQPWRVRPVISRPAQRPPRGRLARRASMTRAAWTSRSSAPTCVSRRRSARAGPSTHGGLR